MTTPQNIFAHFFHWPSSRQRIESFMRIVALPQGSQGRLHYNIKWVNQSFLGDLRVINQASEFRALFWALSCKQKEKAREVANLFHFAVPVRLLTNLHATTTDDELYLTFIARDFVADIRAIKSVDEVAAYADVAFGGQAIASPGQQGGFVFLGPALNPETSQTVSLERLHNVLRGLSYPRGYAEKSTLADYPFIRIDGIDSLQTNQQGSYEFLTNREYKFRVSHFQSDQHRDRSVYINGEELVGKVDTEIIPIDPVSANKGKLDIKIECDNVRFKIPLSIIPQEPWYLWRGSALIFIALVCALAYFLFKGVPSTENALLFSLIVVFIEQLWDTLTEKQ